MPKQFLHFIMVSIFFSGSVLSDDKLPKADHLPSPPTAQHKVLISEGISLDNAGQYDDAISRYKRVLEQSPDVVEAIYELGYSYFHKRDYESALLFAHSGARYKSELLPHIYVLLGNTLDELGKRDEAIGIYKAAIKQSPKMALLHFNLGLALMRSGKLSEAKEAMQQSLHLAPNHASSHYVLATLYYQLGYRVPAILALSRFLSIEPESQRTNEAIPILDRLIAGGVTKGKDPNKINITLNLTPDSKKDEGDFDAVETAMSMSVAAGQIEDEKKKSSQFKLLASTYAVMGEVMSRTKTKGFAAKYYAPFYAEMDKRQFTEAFVNQALQRAKLDGSAEWKNENGTKFQEFQTWLSGYQWPNSK